MLRAISCSAELVVTIERLVLLRDKILVDVVHNHTMDEASFCSLGKRMYRADSVNTKKMARFITAKMSFSLSPHGSKPGRHQCRLTQWPSSGYGLNQHHCTSVAGPVLIDGDKGLEVGDAYS